MAGKYIKVSMKSHLLTGRFCSHVVFTLALLQTNPTRNFQLLNKELSAA